MGKHNMMKYFILITLVLFPFSGGAQQPAFFETLYDVPVMEGIVEIPDMALNFDKPNGRIAQAGAKVGKHSNAKIQTFYARILPQLGWRKTGEGHYMREGESLVISFERDKIVKFLLKPR